MSSITIHGIDKDLLKQIDLKKVSRGASRNKTLKMLLEEALGLNKKSRENVNEFRDLSGVLTAKERDDFMKKNHDLSKIDPADWK